MKRFPYLFTAILFAWSLLLHAQRLDDIQQLEKVPDAQLEQLVQASVTLLQEHAFIINCPQLGQYAGYLQQVLRPAGVQCIDYYEAVAILRALSKTIKQLVRDNKEGVPYPVIRRSYVAAVWLLQRSKMFIWETTHLSSSTLSTMYRLYLHHAQRAQGRTISFQHISKCGGTTMCQLASANRCSNPHLSIEKNCVMDDRLDSPVWMVSHKVNDTGAFPDLAKGILNVTPRTPVDRQNYNRHEFATEPLLDMWLMYACPYQLNGRVYGCGGRNAAVEATGATFMANERALSFEHGRSQVCPEFVNAIILREPIPHVISLLAEVRFRYERQLALRNITSWQPPAWNLTWWETLGPALVGNYATRSLIGRDSFCRSAENMGSSDLVHAMTALLRFDMVMTLKRTRDIDLLVTAMFGWTARNFSSQPATRVRDVTPAAMPLDLFGTLKGLKNDTRNSSSSSNTHMSFLSMAVNMLNSFGPTQATSSKGDSSRQVAADAAVQSIGSRSILSGISDSQSAASGAGKRSWGQEDSEMADEYKSEFEGAAAAADKLQLESQSPKEAVAYTAEAQKAAALVHTSHLQRQAQRLGFASIAAASRMLREPKVRHLGHSTAYGAQLVQTNLNDTDELWHVFPKHAFAFTASDINRLEALTKLDQQLFQLADVMLSLDVAWLHFILRHRQYKKRLLSVVNTHAACGFAGILPSQGGQQYLTLL